MRQDLIDMYNDTFNEVLGMEAILKTHHDPIGLIFKIKSKNAFLRELDRRINPPVQSTRVTIDVELKELY